MKALLLVFCLCASEYLVVGYDSLPPDIAQRAFPKKENTFLHKKMTILNRRYSKKSLADQEALLTDGLIEKPRSSHYTVFIPPVRSYGAFESDLPHVSANSYSENDILFIPQGIKIHKGPLLFRSRRKRSAENNDAEAPAKAIDATTSEKDVETTSRAETKEKEIEKREIKKEIIVKQGEEKNTKNESELTKQDIKNDVKTPEKVIDAENQTTKEKKPTNGQEIEKREIKKEIIVKQDEEKNTKNESELTKQDIKVDVKPPEKVIDAENQTTKEKKPKFQSLRKDDDGEKEKGNVDDAEPPEKEGDATPDKKGDKILSVKKTTSTSLKPISKKPKPTPKSKPKPTPKSKPKPKPKLKRLKPIRIRIRKSKSKPKPILKPNLRPRPKPKLRKNSKTKGKIVSKGYNAKIKNNIGRAKELKGNQKKLITNNIKTADSSKSKGTGQSKRQLRKDTRRLIAGRDATIEDYPYMVSIQKNGEHWCAGALLNPRLVITTANCVWKSNRLSRLRVRAGSRSANHGGQVVRVAEVMKHPHWSVRKNPDFDLALLSLEKNVRFSHSVHAVDLPNRQMTPPFQDAWVTSWGSERRDGIFEKKEMQLQVYHASVMDWAKCNNITKRFGVGVSENFICLTQDGRKAPCTRDTGAPAVSDGVVWGLASWGIRKLCGTERFPAMFSYVASPRNMDFIINATTYLMAEERQSPFPGRARRRRPSRRRIRNGR